MSYPQTSAKIINHSHGQGATSLEDIQQRASELARIDSRKGNEFTDTDLENARRELMGGHYDESDLPSHCYVLNGDGIAGSTGYHVPNQSCDESENAVNELIMEGMEEAEHEQMLEASALGDDFDE
jgi:hypothetical protein